MNGREQLWVAEPEEAEEERLGYWTGFLCGVCGEGFTLEQWEHRHNGDNGEEYHEECCPDCADDVPFDFSDDDDEDDVSGCQSSNHDHSSCYGFLWECENCHKLVCCNEGLGDSDLCDTCWLEMTVLEPDRVLA